MKKFAMIMALALPLAFASCGDDNDDKTLTLDQTKVTLDYEKTADLKASEKGGTWASSNEFVASVDKNGKVTANHEGNATITYSKDGMSASCTVAVNATNNNFTTILTWGATPAQVKANVPSDLVLLTENNDGLVYSLPGNAYPWYGFIFKNSALAGSSIYFTDEQFDDYDFNGYLAQRYVKIEDTDNGAVYANANTLSEASESATVEYDGTEDIWSVVYQPVSHTKAAAIDVTVRQDAKALYKAAKK